MTHESFWDLRRSPLTWSSWLGTTMYDWSELYLLTSIWSLWQHCPTYLPVVMFWACTGPRSCTLWVNEVKMPTASSGFMMSYLQSYDAVLQYSYKFSFCCRMQSSRPKDPKTANKDTDSLDWGRETIRLSDKLKKRLNKREDTGPIIAVEEKLLKKQSPTKSPSNSEPVVKILDVRGKFPAPPFKSYKGLKYESCWLQTLADGIPCHQDTFRVQVDLSSITKVDVCLPLWACRTNRLEDFENGPYLSQKSGRW